MKHSQKTPLGLLGCLTLLIVVALLGRYMAYQKELIIEIVIAQSIIVIILFGKSFYHLRNIGKAGDRAQSKALLNSENLLNSLSDGVIVINQAGLIKFINKQATLITGFKQEEALDIKYSSVLRFLNQDNQLLRSDEDPISTSWRTFEPSQTDIIKIRTYSDKIRPIRLRVAPINDTSNELLIAFWDISHELDKEREQLEFISTASHEMRTPIATINGYIGLALNPKISQIDDKAREYITKAQSAVEHLGELFKNLLNISRAEDKSIATQSQVLDLTDFVEKICGDFQSQLANKNLSLVFAPHANRSKTLNPNILAYTDKNLLYEVISNLIENAIKYTQEGTITVDVSIRGSELAIISVADTGIGIPPEDIPHLFQKFYRVDNSQTREIGGTGLGLYLCRKIIETLHGRIWAESTIGKGSVFFVELARIDQAKAARLQAQAKAQNSVSHPQS